MQFLILAHDATDGDALARRMGAREAHIATLDRYKELGHMIAGAALLDDKGQMNGSAIMADFPSREALEAWLNEEPYVVQRVWEQVQVVACKLGPSFSHLLAKQAG